jgi:hypothetical protein
MVTLLGFAMVYLKKIGGWEKITSDTIVGVVKAQHQYTDLDGRKYAALGSQRGLFYLL